MKLGLKNITKAYGPLSIFRDFSLSFNANSINCILGPSGCGKTTLLNIITGTIEPDSGSAEDFRGLSLSCVFQEPRLLPWKTVRENVAFVLKERLPQEELKAKVDEYIELVQLQNFSDYYPAKLSGGMKQRVSLARAFSYSSDIILLDEPFKALDYKLKNNLIDEFLKLWERDKRTVIFVTHDVDEALLIGHHIFLFSQAPVELTARYDIPEGSGNKESLRRELMNRLNGNA
jgi:NitT/TauT family transport system ATP-binding protein